MACGSNATVPCNICDPVRLETNSTVVWQSAGGVSLILPVVQFSLVFQY